MVVPRIGARACVAWILVAVLGAAIGRATADDSPATADIHRALTLLNVVAEEYREGVVDGRVVLPVEYNEATTFLDEAQARLRGAAPTAAAATEALFVTVRGDVHARAPLDRVRSGLEQIRTGIAQSTGVVEEIYPPAPPSASRGRALFTENCTRCHGEHANGEGPDAAKLDPRPANFTDAEFMRRETPFSFFNIITAGKGTSAMPAWADVFSLQERWDLVSYLYTVQPGHDGLAEGQQVYLANCVGCHALTGDGGQAPAAAAPKPLNAASALATKTDDELLAVVAHGTASAMPGYAGRLSEDQMRAAVAYVRMLSLGGDDGSAAATADSTSARRSAGVLRLLTDTYGKAAVPGAPVDERALTESTILLDQVLQQAPRLQAALAERDRTAADALPQQLDRLAAAIRDRQSPAAVAALTTPLAQTIEAQFPAAADGAQSNALDQLAAARRLLDQALAAYREGNPRAVYLVSDAYFLFDPLEKAVALRDASLTQRVEARFAELRSVMGSPGHAHEAGTLVAAIDSDLNTARAALAPQQGGVGIALQSGFIILREGFEVVLIVGALLAYVRKAGAPAMRRPILYGTVGGALASALTAYALARLFQASGAAGDVLEGATMLLASAVLFFVSYWLIAKAEAERWQRYIHGKVASALATGNTAALAGAAFLAVYREGTETILFYKALIDSAPGAFAPVVIGLAGGGLGLTVLYALYMRIGSRLPMRQFFIITGGLLYYLAVVFAGKGVAELQGAGWLSTTRVPWIPRIELLGLYPTVETLAAQAALLLCVVYALVATLRRARRDRVDAPVAIKVASPGNAKP
jgi:high-affinity iron transporter